MGDARGQSIVMMSHVMWHHVFPVAVFGPLGTPTARPRAFLHSPDWKRPRPLADLFDGEWIARMHEACEVVLRCAGAMFPLVGVAARWCMGVVGRWVVENPHHWVAVKCAQVNSIRCLKWLVDHPPSMQEARSQSFMYDTPELLCAACRKGHLESAMWAVNTFDMIRKFSKTGVPVAALEAACRGGHLNILKWVIETFGVSGHSVVISAALSQAIRSNRADIVRWLCETFDYGPASQRRIRVSQAGFGSLETFKYLVDKYHFPRQHVFDTMQCATLRYACDTGNLEFAKWLYQEYSITVLEARGTLMGPCYQGHTEVVIWLLEQFPEMTDWKEDIWSAFRSAAGGKGTQSAKMRMLTRLCSLTSFDTFQSEGLYDTFFGIVPTSGQDTELVFFVVNKFSHWPGIGRDLFLVSTEKGNMELCQWTLDHFRITAAQLCENDRWPIGPILARNNLETAKWMLSQFPELSKSKYSSSRISSALRSCCGSNNLEAVKWLMKNFRVRKEDVVSKEKSVVSSGSALQWTCVQQNDLALVEFILSKFKVSKRKMMDSGTVEAVCGSGNVPVMKWISEKWHLSVDDLRAVNALQESCKYGKLPMAVFLSENYPLDRSDALLALGAIDHFDNVEVVEWLISRFSLSLQDIKDSKVIQNVYKRYPTPGLGILRMLESNYHACSSLLMTDDDFALFTVDTYHHISPAMLFCMEGIVPEIPKAWALHLLSYDKCCSLPDTAIWIITTFAESQEQKRDLVFSLRERAKKCPSGGSNILAAWCDGYLGD